MKFTSLPRFSAILCLSLLLPLGCGDDAKNGTTAGDEATGTDSGTGSGTADTGETGTVEETGGTTGWTTTTTHSTVFCDTCVGAAELAGDPGGSPCDDGCSTGGRGAAAWLVLPLLLAFRRRR